MVKKTAKIIFVLGPPASGKSFFIKNYIKLLTPKLSVYHINDKHLLWELCQKPANTNRWHYLKTFDEKINQRKWEITDDSLLEDLLEYVNRLILDDISKFDYLLIEFTNPDWHKALKNFNSVMLNHAVLIYQAVDLSIALERNKKRSLKRPQSFVPESYIHNFFRPIAQIPPKDLFQQAFIINGNSRKSAIRKEAKKIHSFLTNHG